MSDLEEKRTKMARKEQLISMANDPGSWLFDASPEETCEIASNLAKMVLSMMEDRDTLRAEVQRLEAWKAEALEVQNALNIQEIGKAIGAQWGDPIAPLVLPWILSKKAEVQRLNAAILEYQQATTAMEDAENREAENPSGLELAGIGRKHFGNPIPQAWYDAARELMNAPRENGVVTRFFVRDGQILAEDEGVDGTSAFSWVRYASEKEIESLNEATSKVSQKGERRELALLRQHWQLWEEEVSCEDPDKFHDKANAREEVDQLIREHLRGGGQC